MNLDSVRGLQEMELHSCAQADYEDLPFEFYGGCVGYLRYVIFVHKYIIFLFCLVYLL